MKIESEQVRLQSFRGEKTNLYWIAEIELKLIYLCSSIRNARRITTSPRSCCNSVLVTCLHSVEGFFQHIKFVRNSTADIHKKKVLHSSHHTLPFFINSLNQYDPNHVICFIKIPQNVPENFLKQRLAMD